MREYATAATELAGLGVADVPLLLPGVGLERELPRPRVGDGARSAVGIGELAPGDVLPRRRPRDRGVRALERKRSAAERPGRPVLRDDHGGRNRPLVPRAVDTRAVDVPRDLAPGRDAHGARRWPIQAERSPVTRDADEDRRGRRARDLALLAHRIPAVAVLENVGKLHRHGAPPGGLVHPVFAVFAG